MLPPRPGRPGSPEGSKCPVIDQFSLSVRTGPRQRSGGDRPRWPQSLAGIPWRAALSKALGGSRAWLARCLPPPSPSPLAVCGISPKVLSVLAFSSRSQCCPWSAVRGPEGRVAGQFGTQGRAAWVPAPWPGPLAPAGSWGLPACAGLRAVLGVQVLGQRGRGRASRPARLLSFRRLPEGRVLGRRASGVGRLNDMPKVPLLVRTRDASSGGQAVTCSS